MSKHTPGPWHSSVDDGSVWCGTSSAAIYSGIPDPKGGFHNSQQIWPPYDCDPQGMNYQRHVADLRLMVAAPELLEALQECVSDANSFAFASEDFYKAKQRLMAINNIARAAIAKATGSQS